MHTIAICVNTAGLIFDIMGALLLWKYGLPESIHRSGGQFLVTGMKDEAEAAKAKDYDLWGNWGMGLLAFGFLLQLISNFL